MCVCELLLLAVDERVDILSFLLKKHAINIKKAGRSDWDCKTEEFCDIIFGGHLNLRDELSQVTLKLDFPIQLPRGFVEYAESTQVSMPSF